MTIVRFLHRRLPENARSGRIAAAAAAGLFSFALSCLLSLSFLFAPAIDAAAQGGGGGGGAPPSAVPCDAFRKNPDGTWTALRDVTVGIGSSRVSVTANGTYGRRAIVVGGVDFAAFLDAHCAAEKL